jgi:eukaryotic translation initiation factor 2C
MRIKIDMDEERNKMPRPGVENFFYLHIKRSTKIRLASLKAYLEGQCDWDQSVLACINFLDHLIRQFPSENMLAIRRNFYNTEKPDYKPLNRRGTLNAVKGIYAAIRMNSSMKSGGMGMGINVDVTNTTFWRGEQCFADLAVNYICTVKKEWRDLDHPRVAEGLKPEKFENTDFPGEYFPGQSDMFRALRRMHRCQFHVAHRGKTNDPKTYTIKGFVWDPRRFGMDGANARNYKFTMRDGQEVSVMKYFSDKYNIRLRWPELPLIETTRDGVFPMECVIMKPWQKYNFRLDSEQTATMIKFAVTRPPVRAKAIMENVRSLRWVDDPYLREFGVKINPQMQPVPARVLQNPVIEFRKRTTDPRTSGRWDLRDQVFAGENPRPLKSWSIVVVNKCVDPPTAARFGAAFAETYRKHGGKIVTMQPKVYPLLLQHSSVTADDIEKLYKQTGYDNKSLPDLMFFVMPDKVTVPYERLKMNMEIRFAMLTQMVQRDHVMKCQPQYCSNVAMKVNAKLGGFTSRLQKVQFYSVPTMMIGCDVSHGGAGSQALTGPLASMAAITMSMDRDAIRYQAVCETNGHRVEILTPANIKSIFPNAVRRWCQKNNCAPQHVFYFRDGVAEGQFAHVMEQEVKQIRQVLEEIGKNKPKITVIVATKRHHIRFFPGSGSSGDKNGNPLPGTVIEHEVTHPFHYDFYLCSHVAIQGTARPVHYHVIHDEVQYPVDKLQAMIYQQCYQYVRSTTPVSIHPAIYYAHLAAARARAHEDVAASKKDFVFQYEMRQAGRLPPLKEPSYDTPDVPARPLQKPGGKEGKADPANINFFTSTMWYI